MPISDDEYDSRQGFEQDDRHPSLSKAELRKTNKPIMEKKRRARINQCLGELKDLILEAMKKDPARHSKLEKADILEMTVRHLQAAQRRGLASAAAADPAVLPRFRQGFSDCAAEATRFLSRPPALPAPARNRLRQHLEACVAALHQPQTHSIPHELTGNIHMGGVPLIPSRLSTGELALVLPPNTRLPFPTPEFLLQKEHHVSAFQTVKGSNRPLSPATSISSCDSLESDPETPPRGILSATFPTPPSHTSFDESSPETQKQMVSSTTISPEFKGDSKITGSGSSRRPIEAPRRLHPTPVKSSGDTYESSPKSAVDYSLTPCIGKKRPHTAQRIIATSPDLDIKSSQPASKIGKIACTKVTSSQNADEIYRPFESPVRRSNRDVETGRANEERNIRREENRIDPSGSQSTSGNADMWRPW